MIFINGLRVRVGNEFVNGAKINYNPLNLPPNTIRVRTTGNVPIKNGTYNAMYDTATLVPGTNEVYDVYKSGTSFSDLLRYSTNVIEVLGANTTGITTMNSMFEGCSSLTAVSLFDTSNVTHMDGMFEYCSSLTTVPLFNTSNVTYMIFMFYGCSSLTTIPLFNTFNVTNMGGMFANCYNVESGALALYKQASSQTNPPSNHTSTFYECGKDTETGAAELAQIPSDWK